MPVESIIPTDPAARKRTIIAVIVTGSLGLIGVFSFWDSLTDLLALHTAAPQLAASDIRNLMCILAACDLLVATSVAGMLTAASFRTFTSKQFPPPGTQLIRATTLRTGDQAKGIAVLCLLCALFVAALGIGTAASLVWNVWDIPDSPREGGSVASFLLLLFPLYFSAEMTGGRYHDRLQRQPF